MAEQNQEPSEDGGAPNGIVDDPQELETLLEYLKRHRAFDFSGYKRASLSRRIQQRMMLVGVTRYGDYVDHLEVHPEEFPHLLNTILINVTAFFRDPPSWEALVEQVRRIVASKGKDEPIRVWSAGCSSGEEPYTIAMVLCEVLGLPEVIRRCKIYATDIDEEALAQARQAVYPARALEDVPAEYLTRYFTPSGAGFAVVKDLRRAVIFGRHHLVQDAPISRVDILVCRNALMYFNAETQTKILRHLQYALASSGVLFLGKAEMLLTHTDLFTPIDLKLRLFQPAGRSLSRTAEARASDGNGTERPDADRQKVLRATLDSAPLALVVIDPQGRIVFVNARASALFGLSSKDAGRLFHDMEISYRPAELRSSIDFARKERRASAIRNVEWSLPSHEKMFLDIDVCPLVGEAGALVGVEVSFADVTVAARLKNEVHRAHVELEAAHEELQSTNEELETTNEELQSTVEELETTNEELQSTNEELETMNEELQSTNEELQTINDEMRQRSEQLVTVNGFFASILASLKFGVAVLDAEMRVKAWNGKMEDLWGLRVDEVLDKPLQTLDTGIPFEALRDSIRQGLAGDGDRQHTVDCTNRRGKATRCKISVTPLRSGPRGVIVMFEEAPS